MTGAGKPHRTPDRKPVFWAFFGVYGKIGKKGWMGINIREIQTARREVMIGSIGETAGKVWRFLNEKREANIIQLIEGVDADWVLVLQAIGWLAREDKLLILIREGYLTYSLKG